MDGFAYARNGMLNDNNIMVVLGLGSNVGDRQAYLDKAQAALGAHLSGIRASNVMETPALLPEGAPPEWDMPFLNMAVAGYTGLEPEALLAVCKGVEQQLGRQARGHWGPREIDIDILAYGTRKINLPELSIPHKELLKRDFAWMPFNEVAPELLKALKQSGIL